ncbi:MAG: hypothetical protein ABI835_02295 [Chloroflexota bacterium]
MLVLFRLFRAHNFTDTPRNADSIASGGAMDDAAVKESRLLLRRVQDHLFQAHTGFGADHESAGFVDVIHHPSNRLPDLNYVTPRRNTAFVSGKYVQQGLDRLRELERLPRVQYIEGIFPPMFAQVLASLGLAMERDASIMVYSTSGLSGIKTPPLRKPRTPSGVRLELTTDERGVELWRKVWRNPDYDVLSLGVEPLAVGGDGTEQKTGQEIDVLMYRHDFPIGAARIGVQGVTQSAHVVAAALYRETRSDQLTKLLLATALRAGLARGATLVFTPGESAADRAVSQSLGFIDLGRMVCYAARSEHVNGNQEHDNLAEPVLAMRR